MKDTSVGDGRSILPQLLFYGSTASGRMAITWNDQSRDVFSRSLPWGAIERQSSSFLAKIQSRGTTAGPYTSLGDANEILEWHRAAHAIEPNREAVTRHANVELRIRRLVSTKAAFGLSSTELAIVCRVSRAALYKWLSRDATVHLSPLNWQRVSDLVGFAEDWSNLCSAPPGQFLYEGVDQGATLLSLLSADSLSQSALRGAMKALARMVVKRPLRRDEAQRQAGIRSRPLLGQLPLDE